MTKDEILKIKEHIEIHARREPCAIKITEIMWRAVEELEHIAALKQENAELKAQTQKKINTTTVSDYPYSALKLEEAKELIENIIRVTWGEGWNYSLDWKVKAEQFIKDSEVEK